MRLGNPYVIRELRQLHGNRLASVVQGLLLAVCLPCAVFLLPGLLPLLHLASPRLAGLWPPPLLTLVGFHAVLCLLVGTAAATLVFREELQRGTLTQLLLLPQTNRDWLAEKLLAPAAGVVLAWGALIPLYLLAAALGGTGPDVSLATSFAPLLIGLHTLLHGAAGAGIEWLLLERPDRNESLLRDALDSAAVCTLQLIPMGFVATVVFRHVGGLPGSIRVFGVATPAWLLCLLSVGTSEIAPLLAAEALLVRTPAAISRRQKARWAPAFLQLLLVFGVTGLTAPTLLAVAVCALPALMVLTLSLGRRQSSRGGMKLGVRSNHVTLEERLVSWLGARWDNPVFRRDLRFSATHSNIRLSLLTSTAFWALWLIPCAAAWSRPGARVALAGGWTLPDAVLAGLLFLACGTLALAPLTRSSVRNRWDRDGGGLPDGMLTPLSSRDLLQGRLAAATLHAWIGQLPTLVVAVGTLWWSMAHGHWTLLPALLLLTMSAAPTLRVPFGSRIRVIKSLRRKLCDLTTALIFLAEVPTAIYLAIAGPPSGVPEVWVWIIAFSGFGFNAWYLRETWKIRIRTLDFARGLNVQSDGTSKRAVG